MGGKCPLKAGGVIFCRTYFSYFGGDPYHNHFLVHIRHFRWDLRPIPDETKKPLAHQAPMTGLWLLPSESISQT